MQFAHAIRAAELHKISRGALVVNRNLRHVVLSSLLFLCLKQERRDFLSFGALAISVRWYHLPHKINSRLKVAFFYCYAAFTGLRLYWFLKSISISVSFRVNLLLEDKELIGIWQPVHCPVNLVLCPPPPPMISCSHAASGLTDTVSFEAPTRTHVH